MRAKNPGKRSAKNVITRIFPLILFLICQIKEKESKTKSSATLYPISIYNPGAKIYCEFVYWFFFWSAVIILEYFPNFHLLYHHRRTRIDILYVKQHVLIQNRLSFSFAMGPRSLGPKHKWIIAACHHRKGPLVLPGRAQIVHETP